MKFKMVYSSETWYGTAKQIEKHLVGLGHEVSDTGKRIMYVNDLGSVLDNVDVELTPENNERLRIAVGNKDIDYIFYNQKTCDKWFKEKQNAWYCPCGVDTNIYKKYDNIERNINIGFIGKTRGGKRNEFLDKAENLFKGWFGFRTELYFEDAAKYYNSCKIVINDAPKNEINMRVFEATACGSLLITKKVPFIEELFISNEEIVLYETDEELKEKVEYYLEHKEERERIAEAGYKKTHLVHSYKQRAKFIEYKIVGERNEDVYKNPEKYKQLYEDLPNKQPLAQERILKIDMPDVSKDTRYNIRARMLATVKECRGDVLDVGTQKGGYLLHAKKNPNVKKCIGIDISEKYVVEAKKIQPDLEFKVAGIHQIPYGDKSFDTVMVTEVLEHIYKLPEAILEIKRVMKDNGQILVSVPSYPHSQDFYHVRSFTYFDLTQLFSGMRVEFIDVKDCDNIIAKITNWG